MPVTAHWSTSAGKCRSTGFSLIELLVVVLIIGLGISLVALNIGGNVNYELRLQAKELINNSALVSEEAIMSGEQWGIDLYLEIDENGLEYFGYRWLHRKPERWEVAAPPRMVADNPLAPDVVMTLELEGIEQEIGFKQTQQQIGLADEPTEPRTAQDNSRQPLVPDIWLLSSGEVTPFELTLRYRDQEDAGVRLKADLLGRMEFVADENRTQI